MNNSVKVAIGSDHAGFEKKMLVKAFLETKGYSLQDFGTYSDESTDYPDYVHPLADAVENGQFDFGIVFCGSGNGVNMTVNKHQGIRSALCWNPQIAELSRNHNNANICAIPARFLTDEETIQIVNTFLSSEFEGGRHLKRIEKIPIKK